ncbi:MAG: glycine zipper 2TM domain-containing protein [Longimicrobiales bacterium]
MRTSNRWTALLLALPLAAGTVACGDDSDRSALTEDELSRELDLALQSDSSKLVLDDTATGLAPTSDPVPPQPAPRPRTTTRAPNRTPSPSPRPTPRAVDPQPAPSAPRTVTSTVPVGSTFAITLNETLSTASNAPGDGFTATLQEPILDSDGDVLIPSGATVRGRVTRVDKSDRVGETAVLNVAFESISYDGKSFPLEASVVEAHPERRTRQTTGQQAGKVAAGAAAGAIIGRVLGKDTKGAIKGAVIGAAAGTAIAMGTADVDVVLPAGSTMRVRTDAPIAVRRISE